MHISRPFPAGPSTERRSALSDDIYFRNTYGTGDRSAIIHATIRTIKDVRREGNKNHFQTRHPNGLTNLVDRLVKRGQEKRDPDCKQQILIGVVRRSALHQPVASYDA